MSINDNLPRAKFNADEFPFKRRKMRHVARYFVHEFPREGGGAVEKLGRKVYEITFEVPFHATILGYSDLYPGTLNRFRTAADALTSARLTIPEIGTINAFIGSLETDREGRIKSGEDATLTFIEDDLEPFQRTTMPTSKVGFVSVAANFTRVYAAAVAAFPAAFILPPTPKLVSPFTALAQLMSDIASIQDQAQLYGNLVAAKLEQIGDACKTIDRTVKFLTQPETELVALRRSVHDVWDAGNTLSQDLQQKNQTLIPYLVPQTAAVGTIAGWLYGDASRGGEILANNTIPEPFRVPAGTRLSVYAPS